MLKYCHKEISNDRKFVSIAIIKNPLSFQYASEEIRNNKEMAL